MASPIAAHPNATTATGGGGVGIFVVWLLGYVGVDLNSEVGALIATGIASFALLVGRKGLRAIFVGWWKGPAT